eukprot:3463104-Amphidinium_carterae.1
MTCSCGATKCELSCSCSRKSSVAMYLENLPRSEEVRLNEKKQPKSSDSGNIERNIAKSSLLGNLLMLQVKCHGMSCGSSSGIVHAKYASPLVPKSTASF